jgi:hypothetical protein
MSIRKVRRQQAANTEARLNPGSGRKCTKASNREAHREGTHFRPGMASMLTGTRVKLRRVLGQCFSYGHATGHAAAIAVRDRTRPRDIRDEDVRGWC